MLVHYHYPFGSFVQMSRVRNSDKISKEGIASLAFNKFIFADPSIGHTDMFLNKC